MATVTDRLSYNVAGRFYVDSSCIDCDQCRVIAPENFARNEETGTSFVTKQPVTEDEIAKCKEAADACATASIGDDGE
ncbi:MAG: ferredoxin [Opitutus sp.]|nr:ferredoxin [Opitutus sp.]